MLNDGRSIIDLSMTEQKAQNMKKANYIIGWRKGDNIKTHRESELFMPSILMIVSIA